MTDAPDKPLPVVTEENRPFWAGAAAGELRMQRCLGCGHIRFPIQALCPRCIGREFEWAALRGRAEILAVIVYRRAFHPAYAADTPYNLALVQLAEGPRMFGNVIAGQAGEVRVGDRVEAVFDRVGDGLWVPRFRLLRIGAD